MNEENKPEHPADKLLGADWHDPIRDLQANAWADLSDSSRMDGLPPSMADRSRERLWT